MKNDQTISSRLKKLMKEKGISLNRLAELSGINKGNLSRYVSGESQPRQTSIHKLAQALDVDEVWIMGLSEDRKQENGTSRIFRKGYESAVKTLSRIIRIPIFNPLSCGTGTWVEEYPEDYIGLPEGYIRTSLPLIANEAEGDSMEPTISNGDLLIFAVGDEVQSGQVGAFGYEGAFYCKRLRSHDGDKWLYSDNPEYAPIRIEKPEAFQTLGKLRAVVKKQ